RRRQGPGFGPGAGEGRIRGGVRSFRKELIRRSGAIQRRFLFCEAGGFAMPAYAVSEVEACLLLAAWLPAAVVPPRTESYGGVSLHWGYRCSSRDTRSQLSCSLF